MNMAICNTMTLIYPHTHAGGVLHDLESTGIVDVDQLEAVFLSLKNVLVLIDLSAEGVKKKLSTHLDLLRSCMDHNITTVVSLASGGWLFEPLSSNTDESDIRGRIVTLLTRLPVVQFKPFSDVEAKMYISKVGDFDAENKDCPMLKALTGYNPCLLSLVSGTDSSWWPIHIHTYMCHAM